MVYVSGSQKQQSGLAHVCVCGHVCGHVCMCVDALGPLS